MLQTSLCHRILCARKFHNKVGGETLTYRERIELYQVGPYKIAKIDCKQVLVDKSGLIAQFSIIQVEPFVKNISQEKIINLKSIIASYT